MTGEETKTYLVDEGFGVFGTDLFVGGQPDTPDDCTTILEESAPVLTESQGFNTDSVGLQLISRNTSYTAARDKLLEAHELLAGFRGELPGGTYVRATQITTPPSAIGRDENGRHEWTAHYLMNYQSTATQYRKAL